MSKSVTLLSRVMGFFFLGLLFLTHGTSALAENGPQFEETPPIQRKARVGEVFELKLRLLLKEPNETDLVWTVENIPSWMQYINNNDQVLSATPETSHVGTHTLLVSVTKNDQGSFRVPLEITVTDPPKWTADEIDFGKHPEGVEKTDNLNNYINNPANVALTFAMSGQPAWMQLDSNTGAISGTPQREHVGEYSGIVFTLQAADEPDVTVDAKGEVTIVLQPPAWKAESFTIDDATEDSPYEFDVSTDAFIQNNEGAQLAFQSVQLPDWLQIASNGRLFGTPLRPDVGDVEAIVKFSATLGGTTFPEQTAKFQFKVIQINKPPKWRINPLDLGSTISDQLFAQDLKGSVTDPDGDALTLSIISGPTTNWATIPDGVLTGTPKKEDVGNNSWVIRASDGELHADATIQLLVIKADEPPFWNTNPVQLPSAKEDDNYKQDLNPFITEPDNDPYTCAQVTAPAWVSVSPSCLLSGIPGAGDEVPTTVEVRVFNNAGGNVGTIQFDVENTNHAPEWVMNPIQISVNEGEALNRNIATFAKDVDGDTLTFSAVPGDTWATLSSDGVFTGNPTSNELGLHTYDVVADDGNGGSATARVEITVKNVNDPPFWTDNPIKLDPAQEDAPYSVDISGFAKDPDAGDTLTFRKLGDPAWVEITPQGVFRGTPTHADEGPHRVQVEVSDAGGLTAQAILEIEVLHTNQPPTWNSTSIDLGTAIEDTPYTFDLTPFASDPEGDALTFTIVSGPDWLTINNGTLGGTPATADIGPFAASFKVSDGSLEAETEGTGKVIEKDKSPILHIENLSFQVKERATLSVNLNDPQYVEDPNGDPLTFAIANLPSWITLSSAGQLEANPLHPQVGMHSFTLEVSDGNNPVSGELKIEVLRDPQTPIWLQDPMTFNATQGIPFAENIASNAKDPDGYTPLVFSKVNGPDWLAISEDGALSGTPGIPDIGTNQFTVRVANDANSVDAKLIIEVGAGNLPPKWLATPVKLPDARVGFGYAETLRDFVEDPDHPITSLVFERLTQSDWAQVTTAGLVIGTPAQSDIGPNTFNVRVKDPEGAFADVEVQIEVTDPNSPPICNQDPVELGKVKTGELFEFDLLTKVSDPDPNDTLEFETVFTAPWLTLKPEGIYTGTPEMAHLGAFTAVFKVTDGRHETTCGARGEVIEGEGENNPPQIVPESLSFIVQVFETLNADINQPQFVVDPDGDPLTFELVEAPVSWITLTPEGQLTLKPLLPQLGSHEFQVKVTDSKGASGTGTMKITVIDSDKLPPKWLQNPITFTTRATKPFNESVAALAQDPNDPPAIPLTFSGTGPAWLTIGSDGTLSGQPGKPEVGVHNFTLTVTNTFGIPANADLIITVEEGGKNDEDWALDDFIAGAKADNLWVVDNSFFSRALVDQLRCHIGVYFDRLAEAGVEHTGVYLPAQYWKFKARPVKGLLDQIVTRWDFSDLVGDFSKKIRRGVTNLSWNSPIWSLHKFFQAAPGNLGNDAGEFFRQGAPMDVMIVTRKLDFFRYWSKNSPEKDWTPEQYAESFVDYHKQTDQSFRISAVAPQGGACGQLKGEPDLVGFEPPNNAYGKIIRHTGGTYWKACAYAMEKILQEYADEVIFRARVTAQETFTLSETPIETTIEVSIGGTVLSGNTGNASDQWRFEAPTTIRVFWKNVDISQLQPGARLRVKYEY